MAHIAPFRALRYNPRKISDLNSVVTPPYDVISPREQERFHAASPHNMIHLELGKALPSDTESDNPYTRAARYLREWCREEVLVRDPRPALYHYELDYEPSPGQRRTRYGFIGLLRLEEFGCGGVCPHEKTFSRIKGERLRLMQSCHANLSPVFALYPDAEGTVDALLAQGREREPAIRFQDPHGMAHRLWRVTDEGLLKRVAALMEDRVVFIADGHHRYETALNYRNIRREHHPQAGPLAPFEYVMVYLSNLNDEGLTILPTHRLLRHLDSWGPHAFLDEAETFFRVTPYETTSSGEDAWKNALREAGAENRVSVGFYHREAERFYLLDAIEERTDDYLARKGYPQALRRLQVVVLDQMVLKHLMALPEAFLADEENIHFKHDLADAVESTRSGEYDAAFLINPTRMDQVESVARSGLIMPHKSTYFYPKVGSGMVIQPLESSERVPW